MNKNSAFCSSYVIPRRSTGIATNHAKEATYFSSSGINSILYVSPFDKHMLFVPEFESLNSCLTSKQEPPRGATRGTGRYRSYCRLWSIRGCDYLTSSAIGGYLNPPFLNLESWLTLEWALQIQRWPHQLGLVDDVDPRCPEERAEEDEGHMYCHPTPALPSSHPCQLQSIGKCNKVWLDTHITLTVPVGQSYNREGVWWSK